MLRWTLVFGGVVACVVPNGFAGQATRQVVGTVSAQGEVRSQEARDRTTAPGEVLTGAGVALLEQTLLETGTNGAALLSLSAGGIVGLRANSSARVDARDADGSRIVLLTGEALLRIPKGAKLTVSTPTATIRPEPLTTVAAGETPAAAEASVRVQPAGQTVVRVEAGNIRVEGVDGPAALVKAGEQATVAQHGAPRIVAASMQGTSVVGANSKKKAAAVGIFASDLLLPGLLVGTAVVAGGTVGGLAASGEIGDSDGDDGKQGGGGQGSPFRAPR